MLDEKLISAYIGTDYVVYTEPLCVLNIEQFSDIFKSLMDRNNWMTSAFISAFNPFSKVLSDDENNNRHMALLNDVVNYRYSYFLGDGCDPEKKWPCEKSIMIINISKSEAASLAKKYEQNAFVWVDKNAIPTLVTIDYDGSC